ncbi:546_t:CDS:2, partial [Entrophospora sp. SA101]
TTDIPSTIASAGGIMGAILAWLFGSSSLDSWGIARRIAVIRNGAIGGDCETATTSGGGIADFWKSSEVGCVMIGSSLGSCL